VTIFIGGAPVNHNFATAVARILVVGWPWPLTLSPSDPPFQWLLLPRINYAHASEFLVYCRHKVSQFGLLDFGRIQLSDCREMAVNVLFAYRWMAFSDDILRYHRELPIVPYCINCLNNWIAILNLAYLFFV